MTFGLQSERGRPSRQSPPLCREAGPGLLDDCLDLLRVGAAVRRDPERVDNWLRLINTAQNLERIADHAKNIAEAVVYLKEGDIIYHVSERRVGTP